MPDLHVVERAQLAPSICRICGESQGPMIDTHVIHPGWGRIYICVRNCVRDIERITGGLTHSEAKELSERNAMLEVEVEKQSRQIQTMRPIVHAVSKARDLRAEEAAVQLPFEIVKRGKEFVVITQGKPTHVHGKFKTKLKALAQMRALYANVKDAR